MLIVKSYIENYLSEVINYSDHSLIRKTAVDFCIDLKKSGIDLNSLDLDPRCIARLRDRKVYQGNDEIDIFGLGFNPFSAKTKSQKDEVGILLSYYQKTLSSQKSQDEVRKYIEILELAKIINNALRKQNLTLLGSGIFRVVFCIPGIDNVVVKIALSKSGRADNKHEADFNLSSNNDPRNKSNFLNVYDSDKKGVWIAVEKVVMLSNLKKDEKQYAQTIESVIDKSFRNTFKFFESSGFMKIYELFEVSKVSMLTIYLSHIFQDINRSNTSVSEKNHISHYKKVLISFINIVLNAVKESVNKDLISHIESYIEDIDESIVKNIFNEMSGLYRQYMNSEASDIHEENLGLKKSEDGSWKIIFTDIDSNTYKKKD